MAKLSFSIPPFVEYILKTMTDAGHQVYIAGGAVRDLLMNRPVTDWDFTTDAPPEVTKALFANSFYDNQFGTVGVVNPQEEQKKDIFGKKPVYEITTFRKEFGYTDRRHPDKVVWGKTVEEDLMRRDFTINAMALKPIENFLLVDPHGGQKDIKRQLIRAVGDPNERFQEDALRMMRAVRIATQLKFSLEEKTFTAIKNNLDLLEAVSKERIRDELLKLLSYHYAADGYRILRNSGLGQRILPEIEKCFGVEQKSPGRHHLYDVGAHSLLSLRYCRSDDPVVKLATLLHDVGKPLAVAKDQKGTITFYNHEVIGASIAGNIAKRLRLSKKDAVRLVTLVRYHQFTVDERQTDRAIRRFIRNVGKENLEDILAVRVADRLGGGARETSWRLERFKQKLIDVQQQPFSVNDLKVDGHDVMKILGIGPGPVVGKVLNQLFKEVVEDMKKNNRKYLLKRIKEIDKALLREAA